MKFLETQGIASPTTNKEQKQQITNNKQQRIPPLPTSAAEA
jgi:hypothetical protein